MGLLDRKLKQTISNGISRGISQGIGQAVSSAVNKVVEPKATELANKAADQISSSATAATQQYASSKTELQGAFANLEQAMSGYATQVSKNLKICPQCGAGATADKKFCPQCGAKLPEQTLAEGAVCPKCGTQNTIGTRFCAECGEKLPAAIAEEAAAQAKNDAVLGNWEAQLPNFPVWSGGGTDLELENGGDYYAFHAYFASNAAAVNAVNQYRALLQANGFKQAGMYPSVQHLYKKVDGVCYHVDSEHLFEGSDNLVDLYFNVAEPSGGYDYVKPEPKKSSSLGDSLFNLFK